MLSQTDNYQGSGFLIQRYVECSTAWAEISRGWCYAKSFLDVIDDEKSWFSMIDMRCGIRISGRVSEHKLMKRWLSCRN